MSQSVRPAVSLCQTAAWLFACGLVTAITACGGDGGGGGSAVAQPPLGRGVNNDPLPSRLAAGTAHTCFVDSARKILCWGANDRGQLGDGSRIASVRPQEVPGVDQVIAISSGGDHTCVLQEAGTVLCWGAGTQGQLGQGQAADSDEPVAVDLPATRILAIAAGRTHTCALADDDTVSCWGSNASGQLGRPTSGVGSVAFTVRPIEVRGLPQRPVILGAGWDHTCVAQAVQPPTCWGANDQGQVGNGATQAVALFSTVQGLAADVRVRAIAGGRSHSCLLTNRNEQFCWGSNATGELGTGTASAQPSLSAVAVVQTDPDPLAGFTAMSLGDGFTCAVKVLGVRSEGALTCWGRNGSGELGQDSTVLVQSAAVLDVRGVAQFQFVTVGSGDNHSCGVDDDERLRCWGVNTSVQLGTGAASAQEDLPVRPLGSP